MNSEIVVIKARYNLGKRKIARKLLIKKDIKLVDLEDKLHDRFDVNYDKKIEIYYLDEEKDYVAITHQEELALAMETEDSLTLELIVKSKIVESFCTYPKISRGNPGDIIDVLIEDQWLTLSNALRDDTKAWGTHIYTEDSDVVKALAHSEKIDLADLPPQYNIVATLRFLPGCIKYIGSTVQGITTLNYGPYDLSYIIEDVRAVPLDN
ncbi:18852_t:CDS:2 [Acaulospora morrowiae]|uniref:18852_t:CDS:1 n=1 Tax=Acaulospora morrowiae TaxID=94023 RepID=A0A9N9FBB9_9GLOM|nr:18852_t:CDS:2 [Acaulospora morrowiae]